MFKIFSIIIIISLKLSSEVSLNSTETMNCLHQPISSNPHNPINKRLSLGDLWLWWVDNWSNKSKEWDEFAAFNPSKSEWNVFLKCEWNEMARENLKFSKDSSSYAAVNLSIRLFLDYLNNHRLNRRRAPDWNYRRPFTWLLYYAEQFQSRRRQRIRLFEKKTENSWVFQKKGKNPSTLCEVFSLLLFEFFSQWRRGEEWARARLS